MPHDVVLIPGDGIGPEVAEAVRRVFDAAKAPVSFIERYAGEAALERGMDGVLPDETVKTIRQHGVALKGPCTTPVGRGFSSVNVALRKKLNLDAAVRPFRSISGVKTRYDEVDLVVVRENTEGLYSGIENLITDGVVVSMKVATRVACRRIAHWAFRYATHRKRRKITVFHKANIMKMSDGMLLEEARTVHEQDYPNIEYEEVIVDAGHMRLVQNPKQFDIILCENLYGDIVSDLCAGLVVDSAGASWAGLLGVLRRGGRLVNLGRTASSTAGVDLPTLFWRHLSVLGSSMGSPRDFAALLAHVESSTWVPVVDEVVPLDEVATAYARLGDPERVGKVVLDLS
jgi:isocitrate dehydrogenase (NAD+)